MLAHANGKALDCARIPPRAIPRLVQSKAEVTTKNTGRPASANSRAGADPGMSGHSMGRGGYSRPSFQPFRRI